MRFNETKLTDHYKDRIKDRIDNSTLVLPFQLPQVKDFTEGELHNLLKVELDKRIKEKAFQAGSQDYTKDDFVCLIIAEVSIIYKGKSYLPTFISDGPKGYVYYAPILNDALITLVTAESADPSTLLSRCVQHLKRSKQVNVEPEDFTLYRLPGYKIVFDLDKFIQSLETPKEEKKVTAEDLPYKVRTDYRKDADFEHITYGKGKIINSSTGVKGIGDAHGKLDWVDVDFKKPFVSQGKLTTVRRIPGIFTKIGLN